MTKKILKAFIILLLMAPISVFIFDIGVSAIETLKVKIIQHKIKNIPNVMSVDINRYDRYMELENISATITTKCNNTITLRNLYTKHFDLLEDVYIDMINDFWFITFANDDFVYGINIGKGSPIENTLGFEFNSLEDIVMSLDSVCNYVNTLQEFPQYNYLQGDDGKCHIVKINTDWHHYDHLEHYLGFDNYKDFLKHLTSTNNN